MARAAGVAALVVMLMAASGCGSGPRSEGSHSRRALDHRSAGVTIGRAVGQEIAQEGSQAGQRTIAEALAGELALSRPGDRAITSVLAAPAEDLGTSGLSGALRGFGLLALGASASDARERGQVSYQTQVGEFARAVPTDAVTIAVQDERAPEYGYPGEVSSTEIDEVVGPVDGSRIVRVRTRRGDTGGVVEGITYIATRDTRLVMARATRTVADGKEQEFDEAVLGSLLVALLTPGV